MVISNSNRNLWSDASFWQGLCPGLCVESSNIKPSKDVDANANFIETQSTKIDSEETENRRRCLIEDGYAMIDDLLDSFLIQKLLKGVETLQAEKYPASFILLFDETWHLARLSQQILKQSTHKNNKFHFDIVAWYIEAEGFSPHRDRQPENSPASFHEDQQAKFVTHWIALSDATPENSCLYVIPKSQDPGYFQGDVGTNAEDPLRCALSTKAAFQHIRCLPRPSGKSLIFTHRIIHWGSARPKQSKLRPRVAISFVCSDPSFEKPYIDPSYFTHENTPPFHIRLLLVCAQLLIYYQRFDLPKETIKACYEYCKEFQDELEETYRHKVFLEFVNAMKEADDKGDSTTQNEQNNTMINTGSKNVVDNKEDEGTENDDEEAMLEEMLNAESGGYGEFEDDYDNNMNEEDKDDANFQEDEGNDEDEGDDEDEEGVSLFGKPKENDEPNSKRIKTNC